MMGFEIYIMNWHIGKSNHIHEEEKKRFQRFFRNKDKIHYTRISFQEFCEKGIYNLRY